MEREQHTAQKNKQSFADAKNLMNKELKVDELVLTMKIVLLPGLLLQVAWRRTEDEEDEVLTER